MVCGVFKVIKVPKNQVGAVVAEFNLDSPTKVEKTEESDDLYGRGDLPAMCRRIVAKNRKELRRRLSDLGIAALAATDRNANQASEGRHLKAKNTLEAKQR